MSLGLIERALKEALATCDCIDALPLWENDGAYTEFLAGKAACTDIRWAVLFVSENRERDGCNTIIRGAYRILIYAPPGTGRATSRDAADCLISCLAAATPVTVTDPDDETVSLKLHLSDNRMKPSVRRRFTDAHGRAVTEIHVPFTAITC